MRASSTSTSARTSARTGELSREQVRFARSLARLWCAASVTVRRTRRGIIRGSPAEQSAPAACKKERLFNIPVAAAFRVESESGQAQARSVERTSFIFVPGP